MAPVRVRVLSDLHLEYDTPAAVPHVPADLVILAGDIGNHTEGIRWAAETFVDTPVAYVAGNHEYFDAELGAMEVALHDAARATDNVHYLGNAALVAPSGAWRVLGTTLWTDFMLYGSDAATVATVRDACERRVFDYSGVIQIGWSGDRTRAFSPDDSLALHRRARAWLAAELARPFAGVTIVATHHAPHRNSLAPAFAEDLSSGAFVNHLPELVRSPAALWVHGHTHTPFCYETAGTQVVCNPRGHPGSGGRAPENPAFRWDCIVELS
jgi:3',5'-cyclic AMP phosphodiesterase CpdA